jgi:hypothetical protein
VENNKSILDHLKEDRYLFKDILLSEQQVLDDIESLKINRDVIYPCDVIDIRNILQNMEVAFPEDVTLFSVKFAEKYLREYPIFLSMKMPCDKDGLNGMMVIPSPLRIDNILQYIIINEPTEKNVFDTVKKIAQETKTQIDVIVSNAVPGISSEQTKLSWYGSI